MVWQADRLSLQAAEDRKNAKALGCDKMKCWKDFAEKHPKAAKRIGEGGLFVILDEFAEHIFQTSNFHWK